MDEKAMVPYIVHESAQARMERVAKRLWIVIIILIVLLVASNGAWLWYESQWEYFETTVTQQTDRGFNNYIGNDGDIHNGEEIIDEALQPDGHD